jgi:glucosylceramidase
MFAFQYMRIFHHRFSFSPLSAVCVAAFFFFMAKASGATAAWICSTDDHLWQTMPSPELAKPQSDTPPDVRVAPGKTFQTIDGFGGCFNELGWVALGKAAPADRERVFSALFGRDGCAFTMGRLPIGASDFALDWYSLDDTPGDLALTNFSIARDKKYLIPYAKAAMAVCPTLKCWGSPWSPPAWMKTNTNYSRGSLKWEPPILQTYATYLARWVEAYRAAGINVFAVFPQNEPNILNNYPTCEWSGAQLRDFIAGYLGPTLRDRKTGVELWLGLNGDPPNSGDIANDRLVTVLEDSKANVFITGVAFQYDSRTQISNASEMYPDKKLMQSETECNRGDNTWADAQRLYVLIKRYLDNNASSYFAWNMVLDETGISTWNWRQNSLINVNHTTGQVTFNGEYYVMRHFSQFVKPGAKRVLTTGVWGDKIAFVNPDGSTVLVIGNSAKQPLPIVLNVAGRSDGGTVNVTLPARSVNTFVIDPQSEKTISRALLPAGRNQSHSVSEN